MGSVFLLIVLMFCVGLAGWLLFLWAVKSGQYDDIEGPKYRMMDDDDQQSGDVGRKNNDENTSPR